MDLTRGFRESLSHLLELLKDDDIGEIEIEKRFGGYRIRVSKKTAGVVSVANVPQSSPHPLPPSAAPAPGPPEAGVVVRSPMVGTFYRASSPDAEPFVNEGDVVAPGQTLCIIEAMKIMNEIEAEVGGRVKRIMIENGRPVEYNTGLFLVEPL